MRFTKRTYILRNSRERYVDVSRKTDYDEYDTYNHGKSIFKEGVVFNKDEFLKLEDSMKNDYLKAVGINDKEKRYHR